MRSAEMPLGVRGNVQDSVSAAEGFRVAAVGGQGLVCGGRVAGVRAGVGRGHARPGGGRADAAGINIDSVGIKRIGWLPILILAAN